MNFKLHTAHYLKINFIQYQIEENDAECSEEKIKREQQNLKDRTCWSRMLFKAQTCFRMAKCCPVASM